MHAMLPRLFRTDFPALARRTVDTLQLNLGYRCNQSCLHCHVNAGPKRTEEMTAETIDAVLDFIAASPGITTIDLTGGAPELNPQFRRLVVAARARGLRVSVDLGHHRIEVCKAFLVAQLGHELHAQAATVQVAVEVEQVRFEQRLHAGAVLG